MIPFNKEILVALRKENNYIIDHLTQYPYEYMFEVQLCAQ